MLENDQDLRYAREISKRYERQDFLLIAFTPQSGDLLDQTNLETIEELRDSLTQLEAVESVLTILDVPLLESPPVSFADLAQITSHHWNRQLLIKNWQKLTSLKVRFIGIFW